MPPLALPVRAPWFAWLVWALAASFFANGFFLRLSPAVMVDDMMRDFAASGAIVGNLSAVYFWTYAAIQVPVGIAVDRWGVRRLLAGAAVCVSAGTFLFALAPNLGLAYVGRFLIGFGAGFGFVCAARLSAAWFPPRRFAAAVGLTSMLGMVGAFLAQAPLALLIGLIGWRAAMLISAVFGLGLAVAIALLVRDGPEGESASAAPAGILDGLGRVLRTGQTWAAAAVGFCLVTPQVVFTALWGVPFLMAAYGLSRADAAAITSLLLVGLGVGAPGAGWLSDFLGRRKPVVVGGTVLAATGMAAVIYVPDLPAAAIQVLVLLVGLGLGGLTIPYALVREHNPSAVAGVGVAFVNMAVMTAGALLQPLAGWLLDLAWAGETAAGARVYSAEAFRTAFLILPIIGLGGIVAACLVRETYCQPYEQRREAAARAARQSAAG